MDDWVEINRDERHIKRERAKAREMRQTPYYQELFRKGICHYCKQKFPQEQLTCLFRVAAAPPAAILLWRVWTAIRRKST